MVPNLQAAQSSPPKNPAEEKLLELPKQETDKKNNATLAFSKHFNDLTYLSNHPVSPFDRKADELEQTVKKFQTGIDTDQKRLGEIQKRAEEITKELQNLAQEQSGIQTKLPQKQEALVRLSPVQRAIEEVKQKRTQFFGIRNKRKDFFGIDLNPLGDTSEDLFRLDPSLLSDETKMKFLAGHIDVFEKIYTGITADHRTLLSNALTSAQIMLHSNTNIGQIIDMLEPIFKAIKDQLGSTAYEKGLVTLKTYELPEKADEEGVTEQVTKVLSEIEGIL